MKDEIPTWIFFSVLHTGKNISWNGEKQILAENLTKRLKEKARIHDWPDEVISRVFNVEKADNARGYYLEPHTSKQ